VNILITRHDKIGDFVTSLPLFYVVKKSKPDAKIYALVSKVNIDLARKIDFIDEVILYDKLHFWQTLKSVKSANVAVSVSAFIDTKLGWLLFLSGIKIRISPATKIAQIFFNRTIKQKRSLVEKTEVEYNLDLAKLLDRNSSLSYQIPLLNLENNKRFRICNKLKNEKLALFHPGYGGSSDGNISLNDYIDLAETVRMLDNVKVVWVFGPDDNNTKDQIKRLILNSDIIYNPASILDYCFLIRDSELLISTSTGPMHLAGMLNINTISFFGSNLFASPKRWSTVSDTNKQNNFIINDSFNLDNVKEVFFKVLC